MVWDCIANESTVYCIQSDDGKEKVIHCNQLLLISSAPAELEDSEGAPEAQLHMQGIANIAAAAHDMTYQEDETEKPQWIEGRAQVPECKPSLVSCGRGLGVY